MPTLRVITEGRPGLPGPLAQLGLGRDGTYYVVAAGRANHAGEGSWRGIRGNSAFIGIEAENSGAADDAWPDVQQDAYRRGVAAILAHVGADADMCCGHKEYAPRRKPDPSFDMEAFRREVRNLMAGAGAVRPMIAAADRSGKATIRRGARGDAVKRVQKVAGVVADGLFGPGTEAAVRRFQRSAGLVPDGIVGPATWALIG